MKAIPHAHTHTRTHAHTHTRTHAHIHTVLKIHRYVCMSRTNAIYYLCQRLLAPAYTYTHTHMVLRNQRYMSHTKAIYYLCQRLLACAFFQLLCRRHREWMRGPEDRPAQQILCDYVRCMYAYICAHKHKCRRNQYVIVPLPSPP